VEWRASQRGFSLTQLVLAVTLLLALAFVLPAWLAVRLNRARVARAERDLHAIAEALTRFERDHGYLPGRARIADWRSAPSADSVDLLVGPGDIPRVSEGAGVGWKSTRSGLLGNELRGVRVPADPWGFRYSVSVGSTDPFVLSAGPNGSIETPYVQAAGHVLRGDDVGIALR
jgi:type II secretory pathway pseudopilin PulG